MEVWIIETMENFGYMGIMVLIAFENLFPPIPSEIILTFSGFMTTYTNLTIIGVVWFATLGSVIGAVFLYGAGYLLNENRMKRFIERWGSYFRLTKGDIDKAQTWFIKYGAWTVFFCRFIPLIRSLISIPAGMAQMNFGVFLLFTLLGTFIWNCILIYLGATLGASWEDIIVIMDAYANFVYIGLAIILGVAMVLFLKKKKA